nr:LysR substrate-binding domain-containing protein [Roseovarius arcticus]
MAIETALTGANITVMPILDLSSREGIWKAVEQGLGIGFVADFEFVPHQNLRAIPIIVADIRTRYFLAFLRERAESRVINSFQDVAVALRT